MRDYIGRAAAILALSSMIIFGALFLKTTSGGDWGEWGVAMLTFTAVASVVGFVGGVIGMRIGQRGSGLLAIVASLPVLTMWVLGLIAVIAIGVTSRPF